MVSPILQPPECIVIRRHVSNFDAASARYEDVMRKLLPWNLALHSCRTAIGDGWHRHRLHLFAAQFLLKYGRHKMSFLKPGVNEFCTAIEKQQSKMMRRAHTHAHIQRERERERDGAELELGSCARTTEMCTAKPLRRRRPKA